MVAQTMIRVDKATADRLKELAEPQSVASYLRGLSLKKETISDRIKTLEDMVGQLRQGSQVRSELQLKAITKMDADVKARFDFLADAIQTNNSRLIPRLETDEATLKELAKLPGIINDLFKQLSSRIEKLEGK